MANCEVLSERGEEEEDLREEREGGVLIVDSASDGDEFALLDFSFESNRLFDCGVFACIVGGGGHDASFDGGVE